MKFYLLLFVNLIFLSFSTLIFACDGPSCDSQQVAYESAESVCSTCQCTDRGYRFNDCISKNEYCEAFGNVGAR